MSKKLRIKVSNVNLAEGKRIRSILKGRNFLSQIRRTTLPFLKCKVIFPDFLFNVALALYVEDA